MAPVRFSGEHDGDVARRRLLVGDEKPPGSREHDDDEEKDEKGNCAEGNTTHR